MKIAVAATEDNLKSHVDPHFGRCNWFCLFDTETKEHSFVENPVRNQLEMAGPGAVDFLIKKGVKMAIAGRFGSKVIDIFRSKNIQMIIPENNQTISNILNSMK